jgi:hypothetical protein
MWAQLDTTTPELRCERSAPVSGAALSASRQGLRHSNANGESKLAAPETGALRG